MVFLLRHGKSSWSDAILPDFDRPLAPRVERAARPIASYMRQQKIRPAVVLCSASLRTRQTLEALAPALGKRSMVELVPEHYAASAEELLERLRALPDTAGSAMIIGHNPGLQTLALTLASRGAELPKLEQKFPTGALATLQKEIDLLGSSGLLDESERTEDFDGAAWTHSPSPHPSQDRARTGGLPGAIRAKAVLLGRCRRSVQLAAARRCNGRPSVAPQARPAFS